MLRHSSSTGERIIPACHLRKGLDWQGAIWMWFVLTVQVSQHSTGTNLQIYHLRCQRRILHISWHDFVSNDEVLCRTGLFDVSYIVRKRRLGSLFMSPDFEAMFWQTRSFESVPRRGMVSGLRRSGDEPAADHLPPGSTRSAMPRVYQRPRPCC